MFVISGWNLSLTCSCSRVSITSNETRWILMPTSSNADWINEGTTFELLPCIMFSVSANIIIIVLSLMLWIWFDFFILKAIFMYWNVHLLIMIFYFYSNRLLLLPDGFVLFPHDVGVLLYTEAFELFKAIRTLLCSLVSSKPTRVGRTWSLWVLGGTWVHILDFRSWLCPAELWRVVL